jgi:hypothetical protein
VLQPDYSKEEIYKKRVTNMIGLTVAAGAILLKRGM